MSNPRAWAVVLFLIAAGGTDLLPAAVAALMLAWEELQ